MDSDFFQKSTVFFFPLVCGGVSIKIENYIEIALQGTGSLFAKVQLPLLCAVWGNGGYSSN